MRNEGITSDDVIQRYEEEIERAIQVFNLKTVDQLENFLGSFIDNAFENNKLTEDEYSALNLYIADIFDKMRSTENTENTEKKRNTFSENLKYTPIRNGKFMLSHNNEKQEINNNREEK